MSSSFLPRVLCLMGPTASGKTDLAITLSAHFPIEIINVDSAQIYLGMDIGSGKASKRQREKVPHHLMDFLDPTIAYSAAQFRQDALNLIAEIMKRGRIPLLVGGTMLYFKVLQEGINDLPDANEIVREKIEQMARNNTWPVLFEVLREIDPITAHRLKPTDIQRLQRALEIYVLTGKPMSHWLEQPKERDEVTYRFINIGLTPLTSARSELHQRIALRFDNMLQEGLIQEVENLLLKKALKLNMPSMRAVGYRQACQYLLGEITFEQMREQAIAATRQLAKRQLTWLRHWQNITEFDFQDPLLSEKVLEFLKEQFYIP